jgi:hypothetical protein
MMDRFAMVAVSRDKLGSVQFRPEVREAVQATAPLDATGDDVGVKGSAPEAPGRLSDTSKHLTHLNSARKWRHRAARKEDRASSEFFSSRVVNE